MQRRRGVRDDPIDGWAENSQSLLRILKKVSSSRDLMKQWMKVEDAVNAIKRGHTDAIREIFELMNQTKRLED